jgi:hypothetical protein
MENLLTRWERNYIQNRNYGFIPSADSGKKYKYVRSEGEDVIGRNNWNFTDSLIEPTTRKKTTYKYSPTGMPQPTQKVQWKL